jgi:hypothetical protein
VDPPVDDEFFQSNPGNLSPTGSKLDSVIASGVSSMMRSTPRQRFDRSDVTAFAANDSAFHFVIWQGDHRDGVFGHMISGRSAVLQEKYIRALSDRILPLTAFRSP